MFRRVLFIVGIVGIWSCKNTKLSIPEKPQLIGLSSIIQLKRENNNTIFLSEYFHHINTIDSVSINNGFSIKWFKNCDSALISAENSKFPFAELSVFSKEFEYIIPIKKSNKKIHDLQFQTLDHQLNVKVKGTFNGWNANANPMKYTEKMFVSQVELSEGKNEYLLVVNGKEMRDPMCQDSISNGMGNFNSVIYYTLKSKEIKLQTYSFSDNKIILNIDSANATKACVLYQNFRLKSEIINNQCIIDIPSNNDNEIQFIRAWVYNTERVSNDVLIPVKNGKVMETMAEFSRTEMHAAVIYNPMIDRFFDGNKNNNKPINNTEIVHPKLDFYGGDVAGITQKIETGYFKKLGINTIWISPVIKNPTKPYGDWKKPKTKFSAYHGYWPISSTLTDERFCTEQELKQLIEIAHKNNINILLDYVAHHIHIEHPTFKSKPNWYTNLYLPNGEKNTEKWDEYRLTTWFDDFLPTFNFAKKEVVESLTDSAVWWFDKYEIDGFRHDATKHIPEHFWRKLNEKLKNNIIEKQGRSIFQIGETYGSPELISSYISTGMLDAQFDFNMYDAAVNAFKTEKNTCDNLILTLKNSLQWYGSHHLMGNITGNQDRPRFISLADGSIVEGDNTKQIGWDKQIEIKEDNAYQKLFCLNAFMHSIPGIPVIFYGDEIGMPGANDPDCRRLMRFENLTERENWLMKNTSKLIEIRRKSMALCFGDCNYIKIDDNCFMVIRNYFNEKRVCVFNTSGKSKKLQLTSSYFGENKLGLLGLNATINNGNFEFELRAFSVEIF